MHGGCQGEGLQSYFGLRASRFNLFSHHIGNPVVVVGILEHDKRGVFFIESVFELFRINQVPPDNDQPILEDPFMDDGLGESFELAGEDDPDEERLF